MSTSKLTNNTRILFVAFIAALVFTVSNVPAWTTDANDMAAVETIEVAYGTTPGMGGG